MTYFDDARRRAAGRRSRWNLLLIPVSITSIGLIWIAISKAFCGGAVWLDPDWNYNDLSELGKLLAVVPFIFPSIAFGLIAGNTAVRLFPPARRALDREASTRNGSNFGESCRELGLFGFVALLFSGFVFAAVAYFAG